MNSLSLGEPGGQSYDLARAIRNILEEIGKDIPTGAALIKELLQNADDAGATKLVLILDERPPHRELAKQLEQQELSQLQPLLEPALLVRNDAPFRKTEDGHGHDDFRALRTVAEGHKLNEVSSAGRFGIGFNSVYFLTDTPIIFSRQEVHLFDPLHLCFGPNGGWRFQFKDFGVGRSSAGVLKQLLSWCLPAQGLEGASFDSLAQEMKDYRQAVLRLPFRRPGSDKTPLYLRHLAENAEERTALLREMLHIGARSLVFLKRVRQLELGRLGGKGYELLAKVRATDSGVDLGRFCLKVDERAPDWMAGIPQTNVDSKFYRQVIQIDAPGLGEIPPAQTWNFLVRQQVNFECDSLQAEAQRLHRNGERAVPWVGSAFPCDVASFDEHERAWRVCLPIVAQGPCDALLHLAGFVDPSRQGLSFRKGGSDEERRKTEWNLALMKFGLAPLLREASAELLEQLPELVNDSPDRYLSLLPALPVKDEEESISQHLKSCFHEDSTFVRVPDLWGNPVEVLTADETASETLERIPIWLAAYKDRFQALKGPSRYFVSYALGDALSKMLGSKRVGGQARSDVYRAVLQADAPPKLPDLDRLLDGALKEDLSPGDPDGWWALVRTRDEKLVRYDPEALFFVDDSETLPPEITAIQESGIVLNKFKVVRREQGLANKKRLRQLVAVENVIDNPRKAVPAALARLENADCHDVARPEPLKPLIDFLCEIDERDLPKELSLAFLVRCAHNKSARRELGVIFLQPEAEQKDSLALWEGILRRVFAEVAPGAASENLRELLRRRPGLQDRLESGDECRVEWVRPGRMLEILHRAVERRQTVVDDMVTALKKCPEFADRAAGLLLREVQDRWEELDEDLQLTACKLPIHRTSKGDLIALLGTDGELSDIPESFQLQGDETELQDAPIDLGTDEVLLRRGSAVSYRFYRDQLRISTHGRAALVKKCLQQIGTVPENVGILRYLERYFQDTVEQLRAQESSHDRADADQLEHLLTEARLVPGYDEEWHPVSETVVAWECDAAMEKKKWAKRDRQRLIACLAPRPVATYDTKVRSVLEGLVNDWSVWTVKDLVEAAIASETPEADLASRARIVELFHGELDPEAMPEVAEAISGSPVPLLVGGRQPLGESSTATGQIPTGLLQAFAPGTIDVQSLAREWKLAEGSTIRVLQAFGVKKTGERDLNETMVADFPGGWPQCDPMATLCYIAKRPELAERLSDSVEDMEVVQVHGGWSTPRDVLAFEWLETRPPFLNPKTLPQKKGVEEYILRLWSAWSHRRTTADVVDLVWEAYTSGSAAPEARRAREFYAWLGRVADKVGVEEVAQAVDLKKWVLSERQGSLELLAPKDSLVHTARDLLAREFWCATDAIDQLPAQLRKELDFQEELPNTLDSLQKLSLCLEHADQVTPAVAFEAYRAVRPLCEDEELEKAWLELSAHRPLFRLFRNPDRQVTRFQLFLGKAGEEEDYGQWLYCLRQHQAAAPAKLSQLYKALGVAGLPNRRHAVAALNGLNCSKSKEASKIHARLADLLRRGKDDAELASEQIEGICLRACDNCYRPLSELFISEELGDPACLHKSSQSRIARVKDGGNRKILRWLNSHHPEAVRELAAFSRGVLFDPPEPVVPSGETDDKVRPWQEWLELLVEEGSTVRARLVGAGLDIPVSMPTLIATKRMTIGYELEDGECLRTSDSHPGPVAHFQDDRLVLRVEGSEWEADPYTSHWRADDEIQKELLRAFAGPVPAKVAKVAMDEMVRDFLERAAFVLTYLARENRESMIATYRDQEADPEFHQLVEQRRRTHSGHSRIAEFDRTLQAIVGQRFLESRLRLIQGHGYDHKSVFAELVQNAEDAYLQRDELGLSEPPSRTCNFRLTTGVAPEVQVEHFGRPFNCWRQQGRQPVEVYRYDVEGLLRSSGSFKPHAGENSRQAGVIGRFGLGFKSVYLLTDRPRIHSGQWHFAINCACIPEPIARPDDLPEGATRVVLPLRDHDTADSMKPSHLIDLLPFLRSLTGITWNEIDSQSHHHSIVEKTWETGASIRSERVRIETEEASHPSRFRILRLRSASLEHLGQVALQLDDEGLPEHWNRERDIYVSLPLLARLGCGVAVSHAFQIQSGRTHLLPSGENSEHYGQLADLLPGLVPALLDGAGNHPARRILERFWTLWKWDRGDHELQPLREALAAGLVSMAREAQVVPTLADHVCARLTDDGLISLKAIPDSLAEELVKQKVQVKVDGKKVTLKASLVVAPDFLKAYDRAVRVSQSSKSSTVSLLEVGWSELEEAFLAKPLLAQRPHLVGAMARTLTHEQRQKVRQWLVRCQLAGVRGGEEQVATAAELMDYDADGIELLPERLLFLLSPDYDEMALELLRVPEGVRDRPTQEEILNCLRADLDQRESIKLIRYLGQGRQWTHYIDLQCEIRDAWIEAGANKKVTPGAAYEKKILSKELLIDPRFREWLGVEEAPKSKAKPIPIPDPVDILGRIYSWWTKNRTKLESDYVSQTYPFGDPGHLLEPETSVEIQRSWLILFLLGSAQSMGHFRDGQHRNFLEKCDRKGWLSVFINPDSTADDWVGLMESHLDDLSSNDEYAHWMRNFLAMYQLSRGLADYIDLFRDIEKLRGPFTLRDIQNPQRSRHFQGTGFTPRPLRKVLGDRGSQFVLRELVRRTTLKSKPVSRLCFVDYPRTRKILDFLRNPDFRQPMSEQLPYEFLLETFSGDSKKASFDGCFDIPFQVIAKSTELQQDFFGFQFREAE